MAPLDIAMRVIQSNAEWQRHPLGFVFKKKLNSDGSAYRLHAWGAPWGQPQHPELPVHDHIFDLQSHLLLGHLVYRAFATCENDPNPTHCEFTVKYSGNESILVRTARMTHVSLLTERSIGPNDSYSVAAGSFHETYLCGDFALSLVVTSPSYKASPRVLAPLSITETQIRYERQWLSSEEVFSLNAEAARRLSQS